MIIRSILLVVTIIASSVVAFGQADHLLIKSKKVEYKRTGTEVPDYKKTFEVRYPIIESKLPNGVKKTIEKEIDYWRVFKMSRRDNLREDHWLSSFDYEIKYNKNYLLDIWLTVEGVGAYPDSSTKYIVVDIRSGRKLAFRDLFRSNKLLNLLNDIRKTMRKSEASLEGEEKEELRIHREDEIYRQYHPGPDKLELKNLVGFSIGSKGVTFIYDYGYAHVVQALEPSGEFLLSWAQLRPYIKPGGLLARFIR